MTPCCAEHPDRCPMCKRPWDQPEDPDTLADRQGVARLLDADPRLRPEACMSPDTDALARWARDPQNPTGRAPRTLGGLENAK